MSSVFDLENFKKFVIDNNLVSYATSWVVAVAATTLIRSTVGDLFLPSVYLLIVFLLNKTGFPVEKETSTGILSIFEKVKKINLSNFLNELISFIIIIIILYYIITFVILNWIDENGNYQKQKDKQPKTSTSSQPDISNNFYPFFV